MDPIMLAHITAGTLGLGAGPVAMLAGKHRGLHTTAGWAYQVCCAVLCGSALLFVVRDIGFWGFGIIAVATETCAAGSVVVRRRHRVGWMPRHVNLALSSYVSFVTAFVVVTAGGFWWVLPVVAGSVLISVVVSRIRITEQRAVSARASRVVAAA